MYLTRLSLTNFRAFSRLDLDFPRRIILLYGANAQGKTSILEAVSFLATFSSFHASNERQLLNFNMAEATQMVGRIVAEYQRASKKHTLEVRLILERNGTAASPRFRKEILLDGVKRRVGDVLGHFNAVIFLPQMARIIEGSPSDRRRYVDELLAQIVPHYGKHLSDYAKVLSQRNALLKMLSEQGGDARQLEVWDDMLAKHGAAIMHARIQALDELELVARRVHQQLTHGAEILRLSYQPAYEPLPQPKGQLLLPVETTVDRSSLKADEIQAGLKKALHAAYREDISRGITTLGPHRDDLRFISNQIDLGDFGSRGQSRTVLLAMKLAEVQWMHQKTGEWPVLLLDEIMSELDPQRRDDLLTALDQVEQGLITSTDLDMFEDAFVAKHDTWLVEGGRVLPQTKQ